MIRSELLKRELALLLPINPFATGGLMGATPQDVQAKIAAAIASLLKTTSSGAQMVKQHGSDPFTWPAGNWTTALANLYAASNEAGQLIAPPPPPPPTPPMPFYDLTSDYSTAKYNADWDAIVAAGMPKTGGLVGPLDPGVVTHVGLPGQVVQIPDGYTNAQIQQYLPAVIATGLVGRIVVWDEPDPSIASQVQARVSFVRTLAPGVKLVITNFSVAGVTPYIGMVDEIWADNYPARTGWDMAVLKSIVAALDGKTPYGVVLDAFTDGTLSYPLPTPAELQSEIDYVLTTNAVIMPVYAWPVDPSLRPVLKQYAA